jgi:hypothetical protein
MPGCSAPSWCARWGRSAPISVSAPTASGCCAWRAAGCPALLAEPFYFYRSHGGSQTLAGGRAGRRRVYEAEARVAAACLAEAGPDPDERRLLHAEYALAEFKLRLTGGGPERLGLPLLGERLRLEDRLRAAALALRWRGRLSGS